MCAIREVVSEVFLQRYIEYAFSRKTANLVGDDDLNILLNICRENRNGPYRRRGKLD